MSERVLIYGSRGWNRPALVREFIHSLPNDAVVIHGGAAGADTTAGRCAENRGLTVIVYRANWHAHGRAAGPIRNQRMIDDGKPTRACGFRMPGASRGTDHMTSLLVKHGIPHEVRTP